MQNEPVDVLIIGAGASGAAIAWSLLETRMRILCLEQGPHLDDKEFPSRDDGYELARYGKFITVIAVMSWPAMANSPAIRMCAG